MSTDNCKPQRWRPRFSLRACFVTTTIVCAYLGLWNATKNQGAADLEKYLAQQERWVDSDDITVRAPFLIEARESTVLMGSEPLDVHINGITVVQRYYLWVFGYVIELG